MKNDKKILSQVKEIKELSDEISKTSETFIQDVASFSFDAHSDRVLENLIETGEALSKLINNAKKLHNERFK
jgi:hypothetical protein